MGKRKSVYPVEFTYHGYAYDEVELPIDLSENRFVKRLNQKFPRLDRTTVKNALNRMREGNTEEHSYIYERVYENPIRNENSSVTKPLTFHYETLDLLDAITSSYYSGHGQNSGDEFAKHTLSCLGEMLAKKQPEMLEEDYSATVMLNNPEVQRAMDLRFDEELKQRMVIIWNLLHRAKPQKLPGLMVYAMKQLDLILAFLCDEDNLERTRHGKKTSHVKVVEKLYQDLLRQRDSMRKSSSSGKEGEIALHFQLPGNEGNENLLNELKWFLEKEQRKFGLDEQEYFRGCYTEYLRISAGKKLHLKKAKSFLSDYQALEEYIRGESDEAEFEQQVRNELYRYAQSLFVYTVWGTSKGQSPFDFAFSHSTSTFAYGKIMNLTQRINMMFHDTILWLRSARDISWAIGSELKNEEENGEPDQPQMIRDIAIFQMHEEIREIIRHITQIRYWLHESYGTLPLLLDDQDDTIARFVDARNDICGTKFGEQTLTCEEEKIQIDMYIRPAKHASLSHLLKKLELEERYLRQEVQLVISSMIEEEIPHISKQRTIYNKIRQSELM